MSAKFRIWSQNYPTPRASLRSKVHDKIRSEMKPNNKPLSSSRYRLECSIIIRIVCNLGNINSNEEFDLKGTNENDHAQMQMRISNKNSYSKQHSIIEIKNSKSPTTNPAAACQGKP
jgi:hypothetical protein